MSEISVACFFCEDFRREMDGRCSAIGIYSVLGQMEEFPSEVDRLRLVTYISVPQSLDRCTISVELHRKGVISEHKLKETLSEEIVRDDNLKDHPYWQIINEYELGPLTFETDGYLEAVVRADTVGTSCRLHYVEFSDTEAEDLENESQSTLQ